MLNLISPCTQGAYKLLDEKKKLTKSAIKHYRCLNETSPKYNSDFKSKWGDNFFPRGIWKIFLQDLILEFIIEKMNKYLSFHFPLSLLQFGSWK